MVLTGLGWKIRRIWSTEWWMDAEGATWEAIDEYVQRLTALNNNLSMPRLADTLGREFFGTVGGEFLLAFIAAVAFATILAVVAGLTLAASSA